MTRSRIGVTVPASHVPRHRPRHLGAEGCCCSTSEHRIVASWRARRSRCRGRSRCGPSRHPAAVVGGARQRRCSACASTQPARDGARCAPSACPARCTARCCSMPTTQVLRPAILWNDGRSARAVRGAEAARARAARRSPATSRCPASPRPSCCGCASTSRELFARTAPRAAAQGLAAPAAHRRACQRHVRRLGHAVARRRRARAGRDELLAACGLDARAHAAPGRRQRGRRATLRPALAARWGLPRRHRGGRRRRRQRGQRRRHRRGAAGPGLRLARHLGRDLRRQRRASARPGRAPCTRSATRCPGAGTRCR